MHICNRSKSSLLSLKTQKTYWNLLLYIGTMLLLNYVASEMTNEKVYAYKWKIFYNPKVAHPMRLYYVKS
jgi:hypothetical protein